MKNNPTLSVVKERSYPDLSLKRYEDTMDLTSILLHKPIESQPFDLSEIFMMMMERIFEAVPIPIMVIDHFFTIKFVNKALKGISETPIDLEGNRLTSIFQIPLSEAAAALLIEKTNLIFDGVLHEGKSRRIEAILQIGSKRFWSRMYMNAITFGMDRYILTVLEDVTHDRRQERIHKQIIERLRAEAIESPDFRKNLEKDLEETRKKLEKEVSLHNKTKKLLKNALETFRRIRNQAISPRVMEHIEIDEDGDPILKGCPENIVFD
jgi:hypothetical protein